MYAILHFIVLLSHRIINRAQRTNFNLEFRLSNLVVYRFRLLLFLWFHFDNRSNNEWFRFNWSSEYILSVLMNEMTNVQFTRKYSNVWRNKWQYEMRHVRNVEMNSIEWHWKWYNDTRTIPRVYNHHWNQ